MKKSFAKCMALFLTAAVAFGAVGCGKEKKTEDTVVPEENKVEETKQEENVLQTAFLLADGEPEVTASAAILVEASTGTILYEKNADRKMYPASMTKMLTAMLVLDCFEPEELIQVGAEINEVSLDSSKAGHLYGETLTVKNLIRGLIIPSGNDSANVAAAIVARRAEDDDSLSFSRCEAIFTELMNEKAAALGAKNSHFANAHGYHAENHYTTAADLVLIAKAYMENDTLAEIAEEKNFIGNGADNMFVKNTDIKTQEYAWQSHNLLITGGEYSYEYASGIKTGFTDEAGDCVAASAEKDGVELLAIIFDSEDPGRWTDAKNLFEYGFNSYAKTTVVTAEEAVTQAALTKHKKSEGDTLDVVLGKDLVTYLPVGAADRLQASVTYTETYAETDKEGNVSLKAPIEKGAEVGTVTYTVDGKTVYEAPVYAGRDVSKGSIFSSIAYLFRNIFSLKGILTIVVILVVIAVVFLLLRLIGNRRNRRRGGYHFGTPVRRNTRLTMNLNGKKSRTKKRRR